MKCPRRTEVPSQFHTTTEDTWRDDGTCSYCGSMSKEDFFKAIEDGNELTPTDKNYKIYVNHTKKFYFQHLIEPEDQNRFIALVNGFNDRKIKFSYPGHLYVLPFFCKMG